MQSLSLCGYDEDQTGYAGENRRNRPVQGIRTAGPATVPARTRYTPARPTVER